MDIVDIIGKYVSLKPAGANMKGLCPFHEEKTPSFTVHPAKQIFKCFGCGAGGDVFKFVQLKENVDFLESRRMLADQAGISLDDEGGRGVASSGPGKSDLARINEWAQRIFRKNFQEPVGENARQYVENRGITQEATETFGLGLAVDSFDSLVRQAGRDRIDLKLLLAAGLVKSNSRGGYYDAFRHRLMFPIGDTSGRIIGFGGRTLGEDPAKYLNTPATALFDKSANLFGLNHARDGIAEKKRAIVVEGYTDCMMAHQHGFTEAVATLGTAMTEAHARLLRRFTERVILLFDSDAAGQKAADRALSVTVATGLDVLVTQVTEGKDPCDYLLSVGKLGFELLLKQAVPALEFKWRQVLGAYDATDTGAGRQRAIEAYLQDLATWFARGVVDPIQKGLLLSQLSKVLSIPAEELYRRVQRMSKQSGARLAPGQGTGFSAGQSVEKDRRASNAAQLALRQIVEVLLNDPDHYPDVKEIFDPAIIEDAALAEVAGHLVEILESEQPFRLDELIGRFESEQFGRLITDLQFQGERRGQFETVIDGAIGCLDNWRQWREAVELADAIRRNESGTDRRQQDEHLQALSERARQNGFLARKVRRPFLT